MEELNQEFWSKKYRENQTGWDLGQVSPPLKAYFEQLADKNLRILFPGCGRGHDGIYLWQQGFKNVYFADFSPEALEHVRKSLPDLPSEHLLCQDFFTLDPSFDLIVEQTLFCAIDPKLREEYISKSASLLKTGGKMIGLLFNREFESGPPFGGSQTEYERLFTNYFTLQIMENCYNSIAPRMGSELFFVAVKG